MQDDLDEILNKRVSLEASDDLAERIIAKTAPSRRESLFSGFVWLRPALAIAVVGFVVVAAAFTFYYDMSSVQPFAEMAADSNVIDDIAMYMVYDSLSDL